MCGRSGVVKHRTLRQEILARTEGVFYGPLHAETQLPFSAGDIHTLCRSIDFVENRVVLRGRMRNGEADFDATGHIAEPREDSRRPDDVRRIQDFFARSLMNYRCDSSSEVRTNRASDLVILQHDEPVPFGSRSVGGLCITHVRIDAIGVERRRDRTSRYQLMGENVILKLCTANSVIAHLRSPPRSPSP